MFKRLRLWLAVGAAMVAVFFAIPFATRQRPVPQPRREVVMPPRRGAAENAAIEAGSPRAAPPPATAGGGAQSAQRISSIDELFRDVPLAATWDGGWTDPIVTDEFEIQLTQRLVGKTFSLDRRLENVEVGSKDGSDFPVRVMMPVEIGCIAGRVLLPVLPGAVSVRLGADEAAQLRGTWSGLRCVYTFTVLAVRLDRDGRYRDPANPFDGLSRSAGRLEREGAVLQDRLAAQTAAAFSGSVAPPIDDEHNKPVDYADLYQVPKLWLRVSHQLVFEPDEKGAPAPHRRVLPASEFMAEGSVPSDDAAGAAEHVPFSLAAGGVRRGDRVALAIGRTFRWPVKVDGKSCTVTPEGDCGWRVELAGVAAGCGNRDGHVVRLVSGDGTSSTLRYRTHDRVEAMTLSAGSPFWVWVEGSVRTVTEQRAVRWHAETNFYEPNPVDRYRVLVDVTKMEAGR